MDVAALILWILTAGGGFVMLGIWISKGGARRSEAGAGSRFPVPVIFGHFLLAALGLVLWIIYVAADKEGVGWTAFGLLCAVALLGFTMFALWVPTYRSGGAAPMATGGAASGGGSSSVATAPAATAVAAGPAERHFPVVIVLGHGLLAATTLVLVLLTVLGVGGN
jgi:hypothetical protein